MATRKRPTAAAKAAKKLATPVEPVALLKLTEGQSKVVAEAMRSADAHEKALADARNRVNELLSMIRPEGANGFDPKTMTFYSVPQGEPKESPDV